VVATVGRPEHREVAEAAGAAVVLDYRSPSLHEDVLQATDGRGFDRIVEVDLAANLELDSRVCAMNAVVAVYATDSGHKPTVPLWRFLNARATVRFVLLYNLPFFQHQEAARDLTAWAGAGKLTARIGPRYGLDDIAAAHEAVEQRTGLGNVVLDLG
jgi:NADPH2:quinone reductase